MTLFPKTHLLAKIKPLHLLLFLAWGIFLTFLHHNSLHAPFERDEGEYAYSAWLLRTGHLPYQDSFLQKPPPIIYIYYLAQLIHPTATWPPRLLGFLATILISIILAHISSKFFHKQSFWVALFLTPTLVILPFHNSFAANTEKFMLVPLSLLFLLTINNSATIKSQNWILSGIFASLAVFVKPICIPAVVILLLHLFFTDLKKTSLFVTIKNSLLLLGSSLITLFFILLPLYQIIPQIWLQAFVFSLQYAKAHPKDLGNFFYFTSQYLKHLWFLLPPLIGYLKNKSSHKRLLLLILFACLITIYPTPLGHYYLLLVPIFTLIITRSLFTFFSASWTSTGFLKPLTLYSVIIFIMLLPSLRLFTLSPNQLTIQTYSAQNPFVESQLMGQKIQQLTQPQDKIFIYGSEPQILFHAQRLSSSQFTITYPLHLPTPLRLEFQFLSIKQLQQDPPQAIIICQSSPSHLIDPDLTNPLSDYLTDIIKSDYTLEGSILAGTTTWINDPDSNQLQQSNLILYTKK